MVSAASDSGFVVRSRHRRIYADAPVYDLLFGLSDTKGVIHRISLSGKWRIGRMSGRVAAERQGEGWGLRGYVECRH